MLSGLIYVFRLLYAIRCFRVIACLGFQFVDSYIKGQIFPSLVSFSKIPLLGRVFSIIRLDF